MVEMLLDWNKDLTEEKDLNGSTPLHSAVSALYSEDRMRRCYTLVCGNGLWYRAFPYMFPNMTRFPMEKQAAWHILEANPSSAYQHDNNGLFPVHIAALMDKKVAIRILLKGCRGCITLPDKQGRSFLHIAVRNKVHHIVKYACEAPVFAPILNARDNDGNTALHLAVEVEDLIIFCHLLRNPKVLLNVRNNKDQTPLDLARRRRKYSYIQNPERVIYMTLIDARASHGSFWRDRVQHLCIQNQLSIKKDEENQSEEQDEADGKNVEEEDRTEAGPVKELVQLLKQKVYEEKKEAIEKNDSDQMNDITRTLGLLSVLITTMTFGATFAVPAAVKAGNSSNGGIPAGVSSSWYFHAFMTANATAFVCSLIATLCLMFSGMSIIKLQDRRKYFQVALFFTPGSLTSLTVAFGLGLRTVLAPVGRTLSDAIFVLSSLVLLYPMLDFVTRLVWTYQPLSVRRGHIFVCWIFIGRTFHVCLGRFWPIIFIFIMSTSNKTWR
ncbi:ankyrin repeat-containing protein At2g01680 [Triticum aestivum]|nr:ankyrin repeat-containing protein At2g01680-like [Triticum aestivum]